MKIIDAPVPLDDFKNPGVRDAILKIGEERVK